MKSSIVMAGVSAVVALSISACGASHGSQAKSAVSSLAANPTVSADVNKAMSNIVEPCVKANQPHAMKIISCIGAKVPKAKRATLLTCLGNGWEGELAKSAYHAKTAYQVWKKDDIQPCVAQVVS